MAVGASFSMMTPPDIASLGDVSQYSFVARVVVTGEDDNVLWIPVLLKKDTAEKMVVNFGDGNKWELDGSLEAQMGTDPDTGLPSGLVNVAYHEYEEPGTYFMTIDNGASSITGGKVQKIGSSIYLSWRSFGPIREVYRCTLKCRFRDHRYLAAQFMGFGQIEKMWASTEVGLYGLGVDAPKVIHMPGVTGGLLAVQFQCNSLEGNVEEAYFPNATGAVQDPSNSYSDHLMSNARSLRVMYMPKITNIDMNYMFSKFPERIDVYAGRLTYIDPYAFYDTPYNEPETYTAGGCCIHLHVNMLEAEFKALHGWSSGVSSTPWGARYLRVYATDKIFDCRGYYFDPETGHKQDQNGVWLDDQDRWIDRDGNYVLSDGVTPCVWHDGTYYRADRQGRRLSDDGRFYLNWNGHIVSDCGRTMTEDGEFIDVTDDPYSVQINGNIQDFYYSTKYAKTQVPSGWYDSHPEVEYIGDYYYPRNVDVIGYTVSKWYFYDEYGYLNGTYFPNPPDGRLSWAKVTAYSYMSLGLSLTGITAIRVVGTNPRNGWVEEGWLDRSDIRSGYPFDFGIMHVDAESGSTAFTLVPTFVWSQQYQTHICGMTAVVNNERATVYLKDGHTYLDDIDTFDVTYGNLYVTDNENEQTVTGETQTAPTGGWGGLFLGGKSGGINFGIKSVRMYSGNTLSHNLVPWVLNGHVVMKDLVTGIFHPVTSGEWLVGEYYNAGGNNV